MNAINHDTLTDTVIAAIGPATDPRTRELMTGLITHLHAFVTESRLTLPELLDACRFLVRAGQISDGKRDEFVLMANVLGLEVLVDLINHAGNPQSCILGPMYREHAPAYVHGESIVQQRPDDGQLVLIEGRVSDSAGQPLADALVEVWEPSTNGLYDNQDPAQPDMNLRGCFRTDAAGRYALRCLRPVNYPVPDDGPGGELLGMMGRNAMRAAHVHFMISAAGHEPLIAQLYDADDPYLERDSIFAVKPALIATFEPAADDLDVDFIVHYDWQLAASARRHAA